MNFTRYSIPDVEYYCDVYNFHAITISEYKIINLYHFIE